MSDSLFFWLYLLTLVALIGVGLFLGVILGPKFYKQWKKSKLEHPLGMFFSCLFGSVFCLSGALIVFVRKWLAYFACGYLVLFSAEGFANK